MLRMYIESPGRCGVATPQRPSFFPPHGNADRIQHQIHRLLSSGFISRNAVAIEVPDHGQMQDTLPGMDIRNISHLLGVRLVRLELSIQQILVFIYLLSHLNPFPAPACFREQIVLFHDAQHRFGDSVDTLTVAVKNHGSKMDQRFDPSAGLYGKPAGNDQRLPDSTPYRLRCYGNIDAGVPCEAC